MFTKPLSQISSSDTHNVGGKAASLGEMLAAGIPVPPGFVITTTAFENFLARGELKSKISATLHKVEHEDGDSVEQASKLIHGMILAAAMPAKMSEEILKEFEQLSSQYVAVRSSATAEDSASAAWAGQLDSYLNTERDQLIVNIKRCWASLFGSRAILYRFDQGLTEAEISVGVVVQAMIQSQVSGVAFSVHPVSQDPNQLIIEAGWGLGEAIVSGQITPDSYVFDKQPMHQLDSAINTQTRQLTLGGWGEVDPALSQAQKLTDADAKQLAVLVIKIEDHYGFPVDVEWAWANGEFYITQSRPITTLSEPTKTVYTFDKAFTREESLLLVELLHHEFVSWLAEITDEPVPPMFFQINGGLLETWFCDNATQILVDEIYRRNQDDKNYLKKNVADYWRVVKQLRAIEQQHHATTMDELKAYLALLRRAIRPLHVIFFTPFHDQVAPHLFDLATKTRGQGTLFDSADLYIRDSLSHLFSDCEGLEPLIGLSDLNEPNPTELRLRENNFLWFDGQYLSMDLEEFEDAHPNFRLLIDEVIPGQTSLSGMVAFHGRIDGKVQLIMRKQDVPSFREGNILVAPMTSPHYIPAMRKAIAFITDEGGVTCHAAIIAREMKKPCIVGTKIATKVLKDGDVIKLNADRGVATTLATKSKTNTDIVKIDGSVGAVEIVSDAEIDRLLSLITKRQDWQFYVSRAFNWFIEDTQIQAIEPTSQVSELGFGFPLKNYIVANGDEYGSEHDQVAYAQQLAAAEAQNEDFFPIFATMEREIANSAKEYASKLNQADFHAATKDELAKSVSEFSDQYIRSFIPAWVRPDHYLEIALHRSLSEDINKQDAETAFQVIAGSIPADQLDYSQEPVELLEIAMGHESKMAGAKAALTELIDKHHQRYAWMKEPLASDSVRFSVNDYYQRVQAIINTGNPRGKLEAIRTQRRTAQNKYQALTNDPALSSQTKSLGAALREFIFLRTYTTECSDHLFFVGRNTLLQEIASRVSWKLTDLCMLSAVEIAALLEGRESNYAQLASERAAGFAFFWVNGEHQTVFGAKALKLQAELSQLYRGTMTQLEPSQIIRGTGASPGKTSGTVRIIANFTEANKLERGDILVTSMTRPEFIGAMERAAAFVTDEGGVTCHAAITAREFGVPCIIGTGNATQRLRDGDLVEVDADRGTVIRLNQK